ncbi:hypothetical protein ACFQH2_04970 [Natronoarchaeum sp. GCM10025703]|uniref:hypothetical protein n=1 Tax=Natronoarchaeum sp. GCM10025703 TaxID=3252685 RepID=UPI0036226121
MTDAATDGAATPERSEESGSRSILRKSYGRTFRSSDSILLRSYAVVSALVGLFLIALVLLAMPIWIAQTAGQTALNMIGRALLPLVGLALLAPLVGPVLYAEKNRAAGTADRQGDATLAVAGYLFVASIYLALVISAPVEARTDPRDSSPRPSSSFIRYRRSPHSPPGARSDPDRRRPAVDHALIAPDAKPRSGPERLREV